MGKKDVRVGKGPLYEEPYRYVGAPAVLWGLLSFKQDTAHEISACVVGWGICPRDKDTRRFMRTHAVF